MRAMMADEHRRHVMPSANSAITTYTLLESQVAALARRRGPDRNAISEATARRQREFRQQVLMVADAIPGLRQMVESAIRKAALSPQQAGTLVFGPAFSRR